LKVKIGSMCIMSLGQFKADYFRKNIMTITYEQSAKKNIEIEIQ